MVWAMVQSGAGGQVAELNPVSQKAIKLMSEALNENEV
jgi:hypothetical protein